MRFPISTGKVTCAGVVVILMVLPNSIWKGPDAKVAPVTKPKVVTMKKQGSDVPRLKLRKVTR